MERTDPTPPTEDLPPTGNSVLDEPATLEACARDYAAGAEVRAEMDRQERR